jgi:hypothetical protein
MVITVDLQRHSSGSSGSPPAAGAGCPKSSPKGRGQDQMGRVTSKAIGEACPGRDPATSGRGVGLGSASVSRQSSVETRAGNTDLLCRAYSERPAQAIGMKDTRPLPTTDRRCSQSMTPVTAAVPPHGAVAGLASPFFVSCRSRRVKDHLNEKLNHACIGVGGGLVDLRTFCSISACRSWPVRRGLQYLDKAASRPRRASMRTGANSREGRRRH